MSTGSGEAKNHEVPPGTGTLGLALFLAALGMLFGALLLGYLIIRFIGAGTPPRGTLTPPAVFWLSTLLMLCSGVSMLYAQRSAVLGRQNGLRHGLLVTDILGLGFIVVQAPAMYELYGLHARASESGNVHLFGLMLVLIALHAAHVIGGLVVLIVTTRRAYQNRYSAENATGVRHCGMYWHFLDIVWIVMFTALWAAA